LALDTETTGVDPFTARIVEDAAVLIAPDGEVLSWSTHIVDPGVEIPEGAAAVHGITTERARAEGISPTEMLDNLGNRISGHLVDHDCCAAVVIYNARYDWPLLLAEAQRHGCEFPPAVGLVDPLTLDRMVDPYRRGGRKLIDVAAHYGVELTGEAHGARVDATAAARIALAIAAKHPDIAGMTLAGLQLEQAAGFEAWRSGFEDWLRRTKDPEASVPAGWPLPCEGRRS
jgi:DNA polymerase-3 subunit epsilon